MKLSQVLNGLNVKNEYKDVEITMSHPIQGSLKRAISLSALRALHSTDTVLQSKCLKRVLPQ